MGLAAARCAGDRVATAMSRGEVEGEDTVTNPLAARRSRQGLPIPRPAGDRATTIPLSGETEGRVQFVNPLAESSPEVAPPDALPRRRPQLNKHSSSTRSEMRRMVESGLQTPVSRVQ